MKKPPDKYKCIKLPITSILYKNEDSSNIFNTIQDAVYRTNYITTKTSLLLRLWCLDKYHNDIDIPLIQVFKDVLIAESFRTSTFNLRVTEKDLHKIDTLDSFHFTNPIINTILLWNPPLKK